MPHSTNNKQGSVSRKGKSKGKSKSRSRPPAPKQENKKKQDQRSKTPAREASRGPRGRAPEKLVDSGKRTPSAHTVLNFRRNLVADREGEAPIARDANSVTPNRVNLTLTTNSPCAVNSVLQQIASLIVAKYDSLAPGKMLATLVPADDASFEPVLLQGALMIAAWAYFAKVGIFSNQALSNSVPTVVDDIPIPLPFAKALQYYAPFVSKEGVQFSFSDATAALPSPVTANGTISSTNTGIFDKGVVTVYPIGAPAGAGELSSTVGAAIAALTDVTAYMAGILGAVSKVIPCIKFGNIPKTAPDASAYASIDTTNFCVTCATAQYDAEVAYFLSQNVATIASTWGSNQRSLPFANSPSSARSALTFTGANGSYLVGWIECLIRCPWYGGTVHNMIAKSDYGPLRSFVAEVFDMDTRAWHTLVGAQLMQLADDQTSSSATTLSSISEVQLNVVAVTLESCLIARLGEFAHLMFPNNSCRAYSNVFRAHSLPPWVAMFLWAVGPTIHRGRLRLVLPNNNSSTDHWYKWCTVANPYAATASNTSLFQGVAACAGYTPTNVTIQGVNISTYIINSQSSITPVKTAGFYQAAWNQIMGYSGANVSRGIDADLNKSFGGVANLTYVLYQGSTFNTGGSLNVVNAAAANFVFVRYSYVPLAIASDINLSKSDLTFALFTAMIAQPTGALQSAKLFTYSTSVSNVSGLVESLVATQDAEEFTQSLGVARANIAKFYSLNGQPMDLDQQGNFIMTALAGIAGPILANVVPNIAQWAVDKITGGAPAPNVPNPEDLGTRFSNFGTFLQGRGQEGLKQLVSAAQGGMSATGLSSGSFEGKSQAEIIQMIGPALFKQATAAYQNKRI